MVCNATTLKYPLDWTNITLREGWNGMLEPEMALRVRRRLVTARLTVAIAEVGHALIQLAKGR